MVDFVMQIWSTWRHGSPWIALGAVGVLSLVQWLCAVFIFSGADMEGGGFVASIVSVLALAVAVFACLALFFFHGVYWGSFGVAIIAFDLLVLAKTFSK